MTVVFRKVRGSGCPDMKTQFGRLETVIVSKISRGREMLGVPGMTGLAAIEVEAGVRLLELRQSLF